MILLLEHGRIWPWRWHTRSEKTKTKLVLDYEGVCLSFYLKKEQFLCFGCRVERMVARIVCWRKNVTNTYPVLAILTCVHNFDQSSNVIIQVLSVGTKYKRI